MLPRSIEPSIPAAAAGDARQRLERTRVARGVVHLFTGQAATTVLSVVLNAQLGRILGAEDYGLFFFMLSATYLVHAFVEWGQGLIVVRDVAREPRCDGEILGSALLFRATAVIPGAVAGVATLALLDYPLRTQALVAAAIFAWLPFALTQVFGLVFRGHERMDLDARATVLNKVLHVAFVSIAFALGGRLFSVTAAMALAGSFALAWSWKKSGGILQSPALVRLATIRRLVRDGAPVVSLGMFTYAHQYAETLILTTLASATAVGWLGAARSITTTLIMPASILLTALLPTLSRAAVDAARLEAALTGTLRPVVVLGVFVATGTALFADTGIGLIYGEAEFGSAITVLRFAAIPLLLVFLNMLLGSVALLLERALLMGIVRTLALAISALVSWYAVDSCEARFGNGALGVIVGSTVGELVILAGFGAIVSRRTFWFATGFELARAAVAAGGAAAAVVLSPIRSPLFGIPLFVLGYVLLACLVRLVRSDDLELLKQMRRHGRPAEAGSLEG